MLESSLCAEDQFCHLHFTGSFWDGACYVRRPGPRPKQLHLDAFHVAHLAPCGLHGGVVLVIILFLIRGSIFQLLFGLLLLSTSILLILIPVTQNLIRGHLFCVSVAVPNIWLVVVAIVVVVVNIVIEFMTTTIFRQIIMYLIFCIFAAVIELRIAIVVVVKIVIEFMTITIFRQITMYLIFCIFCCCY